MHQPYHKSDTLITPPALQAALACLHCAGARTSAALPAQPCVAASSCAGACCPCYATKRHDVESHTFPAPAAVTNLPCQRYINKMAPILYLFTVCSQARLPVPVLCSPRQGKGCGSAASASCPLWSSRGGTVFSPATLVLQLGPERVRHSPAQSFGPGFGLEQTCDGILTSLRYHISQHTSSHATLQELALQVHARLLLQAREKNRSTCRACRPR